MSLLPLTPRQVARALDQGSRLDAVRRLETLDLPVEEIETRLRSLAEELGGDVLCAATYLDENDQHFIATSWGPLEKMERQVTHCQYVIATGSWICIEDASFPVGPLLKVRRALLRGEPIGAYLGFPLELAGETVGAVCAADAAERVWSRADRYATYKASADVSDILARVDAV